MKTLTLLRHFEYDDQMNVRSETVDNNAPMLAQLFKMRAEPAPDIGPKFKETNFNIGVVELDNGKPSSSSVSLSHGLGAVNYVASSTVPRAIQTADGVVGHLSGPVARLPHQQWAGENYTGDKYKKFHVSKLESGTATIDYNDFADFANFLSTIPDDANHVVLVTHLPTIRALAIAGGGGGDIGQLNKIEHRARDNGDGNSDSFGLMVSLQSADWQGFAVGKAAIRDIFSSSDVYTDFAFHFLLAGKFKTPSDELMEYLMAMMDKSKQAELALRPYTPVRAHV